MTRMPSSKRGAKGTPHHVVTGRPTTAQYAALHPEKVQWVKQARQGAGALD